MDTENRDRRTALAKLVAQLATQEDLLERYRKEPQAVIAEASLSEEEAQVLRQGTFDAISEFFFEEPRGDITRIPTGGDTND